jgi:hypothetical protein
MSLRKFTQGKNNIMQIKWTRLLIMAILSFIVMYALMYVMVDTFSNVYVNLDQLYMALVMASAMVLIEIIIMSSMYDVKVKVTTTILSIIVLISSFISIRGQIGISDKEFLKAMISHHGAAILMCNKAEIQDMEIKKLCSDILSSQQSQIDWMKTKLSTLQ